MTSKKTLAKLQKIKEHMENAEEIGNMAEAEVFAKKFQQLMVQYELSMSDLEFKTELDEPIGRTRIDWDTTHIKNKQKRCEWIEQLVMAVAEAYACQILVRARSNRITIVGHKTNREMAEYVATVLVTSADKMSLKEYDKFWYECHKQDGHARRAKGYRNSWLHSFVKRILQRLREMRQNPDAEMSTALVRVDQKAAAVKKWVADTTGGRMADALGGRSGYNSAGAQDGRKAADRMSLKANAVSNSRSNAGQLR